MLGRFVPTSIGPARATAKGRSTRKLAATGAIALVMVVVAGCGGSSSPGATQTTSATNPPTTSATTTPTHAVFVAKLDDLCKRGNAAIAPYQDQATKAGDAGDLAKAATALEQGTRAAQPYEAEIAKLTPPSADEAAFTRYEAALQRVAGLRERVVAALKAHDTAEIARLAGLAESARNTKTEAAIDLGAENCGK